MHCPRDGDIYKVITLHGRRFELRYGYYEEYERTRGEPIPIYPDLKKQPLYTDGGIPFVTAMQDTCESYRGTDPDYGCSSCLYYKESEELIGLCTCEKNQR